MSSVAEGKSPREEAETLIAAEIAKAEEARNPTSRQMLSHLVAVKTHIAAAEATRIVDQYCDEKAPGVPHYLQEEFAMPYLKILAVVNSLLGIGALYWAVYSMRHGKISWPWYLVAAFLVGFAAFSWFKTIQKEIAKQTAK